MSAILSAADLNDFISPSVACIKPVETLPSAPAATENPYEVTTEEAAAAAAPAPPASISLTDCLACSGCVTSAEAVLVSLQSYQEVISTLEAWPEIQLPQSNDQDEWRRAGKQDGKVFVATVSPQVRASVAATFDVSERAAGHMIERLLSGADGLRGTGSGTGFTWVLDANVFREVALVGAAEEVSRSTGSALDKTKGDFTTLSSAPRKPILTSACPGWICYAEKTHPHVLPHISKLKSPQAIAGTLVKTVLARHGIPPDKVFHMAIMPCFDKKLEASRSELTDAVWAAPSAAGAAAITNTTVKTPARDVDLVITARELLSLATARGISFPQLSHAPPSYALRPVFPDADLARHLFPRNKRKRPNAAGAEAGSSGGYLHHILRAKQAEWPGSTLAVQRGRNADVVEYVLTGPPAPPSPGGADSDDGSAQGSDGQPAVVLLRAARYYGFRNIQNLVRRLRPAKQSRMPGAARATAGGGVRKMAGGARQGGGESGGVEGFDYVEVMACPGGCTNGGGQVKVADVRELRGEMKMEGGEQDLGGVLDGTGVGQREWLARVDEAYFSAGTDLDSDGQDHDEEEEQEGEDVMQVDTEGGQDDGGLVVDGVSVRRVRGFVKRWVECTGIEMERLLYTTYRRVESNVGKKASEVEKVAGLASSIGGGW